MDGPAGPANPAGDDSAATNAGSGAAHCNALIKEAVQPFLTDPIATVNVQAIGTGGDGQTCSFGANSGGSVDVTVVPESDEVMNFAAQTKGFKNPVTVVGIGDHALRDAAEESGDLVATRGGITCAVSAGPSDIPGVGALDLAAGGTNNIGDANYAVIASALGTLCNRVFGSGNTVPNLTGLQQIATRSG